MLAPMKIALATDHSGFPLKPEVLAILKDLGVEVIDHGTFTPERVDFPDLARKVCASISGGETERGLMLCGTGIGAAIAANKFGGIRACVCHDVHSAHQGVEHDDMNVLCLGGKIIGPWLARDIIKAFVEAKFTTDEYFRRRLRKLEEMERDAARNIRDRG
jgi:ribose 5-phosphate isomerase B